MDTNISVALIGVIGILVGAALNGAGFLFKSRTEEKKIINHNIFNLFQIWHIVLVLEKFDSEKFSSLYLNKIKGLFPDQSLSEKQQKELHAYCSQFFNQFIMESLKAIDVGFKNNFLAGVLELSKVSPVLAYELSNNRYIKDLLDHFDTLINTACKQPNNNYSINNMEGFENGFQAGVQASKKWITKDFSKDLQKDISRLSFDSGILIWISCKRKIRRKNKKYDDKKMNEVLDQYIEEAVKPLLIKILQDSKVNK